MKFIKILANGALALCFYSSFLLAIHAEEQNVIVSHNLKTEATSFIEIKSIDANTLKGIAGNEFTISSYGKLISKGVTDTNGILTLPIQYGIPQVCMQTTWSLYYQPVYEGFYFLPWEPVQYTVKNHPI
ncbi:MAG: hypothetical protein QM671_25285 [Bacillus sp. (in: firmicutes)]|uniref:hypothetical protein n=1 Tax=Bacillus sp. TaxID=1409 RepID=UPI0039E5BA49